MLNVVKLIVISVTRENGGCVLGRRGGNILLFKEVRRFRTN